MTEDDGIALQAVEHPVQDGDLIEFCRARKGDPHVAIGCGLESSAMFARLIDAYLLLVGASISEGALEETEIELRTAILSEEEVETLCAMLHDYGFEYGLTADPAKVAALAERFGVKR